MIWRDTISDIITAMNTSAVYNASRTTTPNNLVLIVFNQAQDWLCMYKPWRDLRATVQIPLDSQRMCTLPDDFGSMIMVYTDPSNIGKPMYFYTLNDNDVARRYTDVVEQNGDGTQYRKIAFPPTTYIPSNPYIVYSKAVPSATQADVYHGKKSFFPINVMLVVAKKIFQDYYGVAANQDPNWINLRVQEELRMFEGYAYNNNVALDMAVKDRFGNPVFIMGSSLDGSRPRLNRPSPFLPSTLFSGGTL